MADKRTRRCHPVWSYRPVSTAFCAPRPRLPPGLMGGLAQRLTFSERARTGRQSENSAPTAATSLVYWGSCQLGLLEAPRMSGVIDFLRENSRQSPCRNVLSGPTTFSSQVTFLTTARSLAKRALLFSPLLTRGTLLPQKWIYMLVPRVLRDCRNGSLLGSPARTHNDYMGVFTAFTGAECCTASDPTAPPCTFLPDPIRITWGIYRL